MKHKLLSEFSQRQHMNTADYEIFYFDDINLAQVQSHMHSYYEIYFFLEGSIDYIVKDQKYKLKFGDCLLIPPKVEHQPIFLDNSKPYRRLVLWITSAYLTEIAKISPDLIYCFEHVIKEEDYKFRGEASISHDIHSRFITLLEESRSNRFGGQAAKILQLGSFLLNFSRLIYDKNHQVAFHYQHDLYVRIYNYIGENLTGNLSLEHLASYFYVSKYHISHIFKDNMGISVHQYVMKKRLQESIKGILSGISVSKVYDLYGFSDYTNYYRAFKKEYGISPKQYKENIAFQKQV
jgi:AraC-type DNA-binding domain-containing proteins